MPSLSTFNDFMASTGPSVLTSAEAVINEAVKNTYAFSRLLKGKTTEQLIQGGTEIRDVVMFDDSRTWTRYQPNDTFVWRNPQVVDYVTAPWRFGVDHMSWTDQEVELNTPAGASANQVKVAYKRLKRIKEQRMWTSVVNGFEEDLWAAPTTSQMEDAAGSLSYSLPYFITEISQDFGGALGPRGTQPFTTLTNASGLVMRINPFLENRWTNCIELYDKGKLNPTSATWGDTLTPSLSANTVYNQTASVSVRRVSNLFSAMDLMFMRLKYEAPHTKTEFFENPKLNRQMILSSREGVQMYRNMLRLSNDTLVSYQDASYATPQYAGCDVSYCSDLDTAAIFPASSGAVTQTAAGYNTVAGANGTFPQFGTEFGTNTIVTSPRFYFVNGNYLTPIFHERRYFKQHDPMRHPNQPFTVVQPVDCWNNLFCNSRQRHGIVSPMNAS